ncbi:MAG: HEAT repeat domain-containing protein [bacterium]
MRVLPSLPCHIFTAVVGVILLLGIGCHHGPVPKMSNEPIGKYEFGQSRAALIAVEDEIRTATPAQLETIEQRLLAVLESSDATYEAKDFACRMLRQMGSPKSVPVLAELLYDENLSDMARFGLQGLPFPEVDKAFRKALKELNGDNRIGVIGSIAVRGDRKAVSQLARLAKSEDPALARASIAALRRIGGEEASRALSSLNANNE